ncbi:MAG: hypothetical protein MR719_04690 [Limosilactobacillus mucosae]|nr:hypothetical protein [Limosilactobacillus mucosae]MCI6052696.1 hypothetical protein [Limosilactobacillus mucosae]
MRQIIRFMVPGIVLLIVLAVFLRRFVNDVNNVLASSSATTLGMKS